MKGNTVKILDSLLKEVNELKRKAELLDLIMVYYNPDTQDFHIPEKWKNEHIISKEKLKQLGETPKVRLYNEMERLLPYDEFSELLY